MSKFMSLYLIFSNKKIKELADIIDPIIKNGRANSVEDKLKVFYDVVRVNEENRKFDLKDKYITYISLSDFEYNKIRNEAPQHLMKIHPYDIKPRHENESDAIHLTVPTEMSIKDIERMVRSIIRHFAYKMIKDNCYEVNVPTHTREINSTHGNKAYVNFDRSVSDETKYYIRAILDNTKIDGSEFIIRARWNRIWIENYKPQPTRGRSFKYNMNYSDSEDNESDNSDIEPKTEPKTESKENVEGVTKKMKALLNNKHSSHKHYPHKFNRYNKFKGTHDPDAEANVKPYQSKEYQSKSYQSKLSKEYQSKQPYRPKTESINMAQSWIEDEDIKPSYSDVVGLPKKYHKKKFQRKNNKNEKSNEGEVSELADIAILAINHADVEKELLENAKVVEVSEDKTEYEVSVDEQHEESEQVFSPVISRN